MRILNKGKVVSEKDKILEEIRIGKVFIYPTDTIYGIGCNALIPESVNKIRIIKNRDEKPFSVIVPSKKWISKNCEINNSGKKWMKKLPGKYTLILKLKNRKSIAKETNSSLETIGVRIPKHWFSKIIEKAGMPFITTSVNLSGEPPATSLENMNEKLKNQVDYIIHDGKKTGKPSVIVNLVDGEEIIKR